MIERMPPRRGGPSFSSCPAPSIWSKAYAGLPA
jgi:hypothetical protein